MLFRKRKESKHIPDKLAEKIDWEKWFKDMGQAMTKCGEAVAKRKQENTWK